jgi:hypothetical protein
MLSIFRRAAPWATSLAPSLALAALLAGCGSISREPPPFCPKLGLLPDAVDLTRFQPGPGRDITDIQLSGRIEAVPADCRRGDNNGATSRLTVRSTFERGTASKRRDASVTYVVTVLRGDDIVEQRDFPQAFSFPPNIDQISVASAPIDLNFPVPAQGQANYRVFVGFRLTADELAYNRAHPSR